MADETLWETRLIRAVTDLGADLADLVQKELRLARSEIVQKLTLGLQAGAWFAIAAVLGFFAVVLILEALVFGIAAAGIPLWGSCLLVAFVLSVLAAVAFYYARRQSSLDMTPVRSARQFTRGDWNGQGATPVNYQQISNQTGDWLLDTVQRKPEAVLLIAAGCALLMRSGRPVVDIRSVRESGLPSLSQNRAGTAEQGSVTESAKAYASQAAATVSEYSDTARQTVSDYAEGARRGISDSSDWLRTQAETTYNTASEALRDQPVLVAALGLAAGAALAAFFPTTEVERRAGAALAAKASDVGDQVLAAAERAGERAGTPSGMPLLNGCWRRRSRK